VPSFSILAASSSALISTAFKIVWRKAYRSRLKSSGPPLRRILAGRTGRMAASPLTIGIFISASASAFPSTSRNSLRPGIWLSIRSRFIR
jgi:hypothetical protein